MSLADLTTTTTTASLKLLNGDHAGQNFPLVGERMILGRHPDCQVVIDVGAVSRQHAHILLLDGRYLLEDLKSRNGTFLNDELVQGRQPLQSGDRIRICDLEFAFELESLLNTRQTLSNGRTLSDFGFGVLMEEDSSATPESRGAIMSKLDISSGKGGIRLAVNPEVKLRALIEITQSLCKTLSLDDVLPKLLESLFKIFVQADRGLVALKTKDGKIVPRSVKHRRGDADESIRLSRTIVNEVIQSKQAILSADAATDERFEMSQSIADFRIRSLMCAPLVNSDNEALGLIQIDSLDQRNRFQEEDLEVLAGVATQAAFVLDNIQMHENLLRQHQLDRDLALAHKVQQGLLPSSPPLIPNYHFFDFYEPANQVGGDFYDYIPLPGGRVAVILADVAGKGVSAALVMAKLSSDVRYCLASEPELNLAVNKINANFCRHGWEDRFVTFVLLVLDPRTHEITVVNAGHMAPLIREETGVITAFAEDDSGLPLGVVDGYEYTANQRTLAKGQFVALYTDGFSEAMNPQKELYGTDRLRGQMGKSFNDVSDLGHLILDDIKAFVSGHPQSDDMCLVCFGRGICDEQS
ncbi:MAG: SpoIIE family protein phosphatase [Pirellulales bacterium]|nr:SpoIIE family protein phosphatase [Pirellulales bacterium]